MTSVFNNNIYINYNQYNKISKDKYDSQKFLQTPKYIINCKKICKL